MEKERFEKIIKAAEENAYLSIGISGDGTAVSSGPIPWERTVSAFNMKPPQVTISAEDLSDPTVTDALGRCRILGCYIFTPLEDYGFIAEFTGLRDLFILHGENIRDLSFVSGLKELFMFFLKDAVLADIDPLAEALSGSFSGPGRCLGFSNCRIEDLSALADADIHISELLVWPSEGDSANRWKTAHRPGTFRFYQKP